MPTLATFIQHSIEVLAIQIRQEKKGIQTEKEEVKLSLFADMISHKNPEHFTKNLLE